MPGSTSTELLVYGPQPVHVIVIWSKAWIRQIPGPQTVINGSTCPTIPDTRLSRIPPLTALRCRIARPISPTTPRMRDQMDWNPEWSRRARGFSTYAAVRELGRDGVAALIDRCCDHARAIVDGMGSLPGAEILWRPSINQGLVRFLDPHGTDHDRRTDEVIAAIAATGEAFFTGTTWRGMRAMRVSVCNWQTSDEDVRRTIQRDCDHVLRMTDLEVIAASPEQAPILANLIELYAHDFSEFHELEIGDDGRFGYSSLPLYWSDPDRHPFLVKLDGKLAGLVLVKKGSRISGDDAIWDMAEFFILRGCRRRGIGTQVAHEIWKQFPGPWEVRVMQANTSAQHFWAAAIATFVGKATHPAQIETWTVFSFESR